MTSTSPLWIRGYATNSVCQATIMLSRSVRILQYLVRSRNRLCTGSYMQSSWINLIRASNQFNAIQGSAVDMVENYNKGLRCVIYSLATICKRTITLRANAPWYSPELREAKYKLERRCGIQSWKLITSCTYNNVLF